MKIFTAIFLIIALMSCASYQQFHPSKLSGAAIVIEKLENGNYLVTAGFVKEQWEIQGSKIFKYLIAEHTNGLWEVKPELINK